MLRVERVRRMSLNSRRLRWLRFARARPRGPKTFRALAARTVDDRTAILFPLRGPLSSCIILMHATRTSIQV